MRRPPERLTGEQVIANARRLVPTLRERAIQTDRDRRVPDASFDALQQSGLLHILKPARYGGFELGLFEYVSIGMELGRGCGSTAWIFSLLCEHCWFISLFYKGLYVGGLVNELTTFAAFTALLVFAGAVVGFGVGRFLTDRQYNKEGAPPRRTGEENVDTDVFEAVREGEKTHEEPAK